MSYYRSYYVIHGKVITGSKVMSQDVLISYIILYYITHHKGTDWYQRFCHNLYYKLYYITYN